MAEVKTQSNEREYTIPLRRHWFSARTYERTSKAVKAIKQFIAKHMKVQDRNTDNVKIDVDLNNEVWFKGRASPPSRVKVKTVRDGDLIKVTFTDSSIPKHIQFRRIKHAKRHKKQEIKPQAPTEAKPEEQKTDEQKKNEQEKEKSSAIAKETEIKQDIKAAQPKPQKAIHPQRMALKK